MSTKLRIMVTDSGNLLVTPYVTFTPQVEAKSIIGDVSSVEDYLQLVRDCRLTTRFSEMEVIEAGAFIGEKLGYRDKRTTDNQPIYLYRVPYMSTIMSRERPCYYVLTTVAPTETPSLAETVSVVTSMESLQSWYEWENGVSDRMKDNIKEGILHLWRTEYASLRPTELLYT